MNSDTEYFIIPGDDVSEVAKKEIERLVSESGNTNLCVSPRGRVIVLAGVKEGTKVFSEVVTLPSKEEVEKYYLKGGAHGFVSAKSWLETYKTLEDLRGLMIIS